MSSGHVAAPGNRSGPGRDKSGIPGLRCHLRARNRDGKGRQLTDLDELRRENERLRERLSRLTDATLRINTSLDLNTVLREVVEGARALTGARFGVVATIDEHGQPQDFLSSGLGPAEHERMDAWAEGPRLFGHLRDLPAPLRVASLGEYVGSLGIPSSRLPATGPFLGMPMRHRGAHVGNFFLCEKEGGHPFTDEDEETLVLFATQAATAIANARTFREEHRARSDLEALIETSPVGVLVIDAATGRIELHNREFARIAALLLTEGQSFDGLLEVITWRRGDGREFSLTDSPLIRYLADADTVRAEEIVLSVPDGRKVTTLINATTIPSADGGVASLVVTVQDLKSIEEIERRRARFLSLVSHELRAPLSSIKGSAALLLEVASELNAAEVREYSRIIEQQSDRMRGLVNDLLDAGRIESGTLSVSPRVCDLAGLLENARDTFLSGGHAHAVHISVPTDLPPVTAEPRRILQVLDNLLANAARHSPTSSAIRVVAERDGVQVTVSVSDKGRGLAPERLQHLFRKHVSEEDAGSGIGGGLGLAICKGLVEAHGGRIWVESGGVGQGTRFTFTLPAATTADGIDIAPGRTGAQGGADEVATILVVNDDTQTLHYVRDALTRAGYHAVVTADHGALADLIRAERPRLVVLDLVPPGTDGIELRRQVPGLAELPVIFICAYGQDETIERALRTGAADYIVKPFAPTELIARIGLALRRRTEPEPMRLGDLAIDFERRRASVAGRALQLTATEFELLRVLALNVGRVLSYDALIRRIWDGSERGSPKLVRTYIRRLRRKLGDDPRSPAYIVNERGVGYRIKRPSEH